MQLRTKFQSIWRNRNVHGSNDHRRAAAFLAAVMAASCLGGCGSAGDDAAAQNGEAQSAPLETQEQNGADSGAMGRYVEEVTELTDLIYGYDNRLQRLTDGSLVITEEGSGIFISRDNGATWTADARDWYTQMMDDQIYIMDMCVGADNTVAVIYDGTNTDSAERSSDDGAEDTADDAENAGGSAAKSEDSGAAEETASEAAERADSSAADSTDGSDTGAAEDAESAGEEMTEPELHPELMIVKPDGTQIQASLPTTEEDSYLYNSYITEDGRIFVTTMGSGNIYEVSEDGTGELYLTMESDFRPELVSFLDQLMILDGYGCKGPLIYDMEQEEYIEDEVLEKFVEENYPDRFDREMGSCGMYFFPGEDGVLYLAGAKGLYRHVIGGSAMEQVIDGKLCTFNNPAYGIYGMLTMENNEFMTLFTNGKLVRFVYDPDIPTVPNEKLTVYSLKENDTIRQAITLYQTANPEVFVEYEIGMGEGGAITRDDALKSLNTKIMAGEGPDVLILDGMPLDSYMEKNLLLDLKPLIGSLEGEDEIFGNIADVMTAGDKICAIPCEIQLPVIVADGKYTAGANSLADFADAVEKLRAEHPEEDLLGICSAKGIMRMFAMTSMPSWTTQNGEIDQEAIAEFLTQMKRIYDAQMDGIPQDRVDIYDEENDYYLETTGTSKEDSESFRRFADVMSYIGKFQCMNSGAIGDAYSYATVISTGRVRDYETTDWIPMPGQSSNVFCAKTLLGVSAASQNTERAQDFIRVCLGKENQGNLFNGFAVNKAAFEKSFEVEGVDEDGVYGMICVSYDDGKYLEMDVYWPTEAEIDELREDIETAKTAYIEDNRLEEVVYEEGANYLYGRYSLEEAVEEIEKKVSLYMAE